MNHVLVICCRRSGAECVYLGLQKKKHSSVTDVRRSKDQGSGQDTLSFGDLPSDRLVVSLLLDGLSLKLPAQGKAEGLFSVAKSPSSLLFDGDPSCSSAASPSNDNSKVCNTTVGSGNPRFKESFTARNEQTDGNKNTAAKFLHLDSSLTTSVSGNETQIETSGARKHRKRGQLGIEETLAEAGCRNEPLYRYNVSSEADRVVSPLQVECKDYAKFLFRNDDVKSNTDSSSEESTDVVKVAKGALHRGSSSLLLCMVKEQSEQTM